MSQGSSQRVHTSCPGCGKGYDVPAEFVGRQVQCQACQHAFQVVAAAPQVKAPSRPAQQAASQNIQTSCPGCGKAYSVPADFAGRQVKCQACQHSFQVTAAAAPVAAPAPAPRPAQQAAAPQAAAAQPQSSAGAATGRKCAICQSVIAAGEQAKQCPACSGAFHADCWEYNRGCGMYGCSEAPPTEGLNSLEIPASHWGQDNKHCPQCGNVILAAAVRCKRCGATFESAAPQDQGSFQEHQSNKSKLPLVKAGAIVLLVLSLLPCTAPLAAIGGPIWYAMNRKSISMLPAFHAALCKIAVGVSICITLMMIGVTVLNLISS